MTTSPPSHIALAKRDSYGFGADTAKAMAEARESFPEGEEEQDEIQAFAHDGSLTENSVLPTDFTIGLQKRDNAESSFRGLIPDSSYGTHLRSPGRREGHLKDAEDAEDVEGDWNGDMTFAAHGAANVHHAGAGFDSVDIANDGSEAESSVKAFGRFQNRVTYDDDEYGDFIQGAQHPQSVVSSEGFGIHTSGPSTPARRIAQDDSHAQRTSSPTTPRRRASHLHPSVSRLRSHFRTPSTSTLNSIHPNGGVSPAMKSTSAPRDWDTPSHLSALSRTSSSIDVKPSDGVLRSKGKSATNGVSGQPESQLSGDHFEALRSEELTGFVFHTMKDCTRLLFQESGRSSDNADVPAQPKAGFMLNWSGVVESSGGPATSSNARGEPTVMAVNGLIAVGSENGCVIVMDFKQELKRVCGTEATVKLLGAVTAIAISPDSTFVAVGHQSGSVCLYDLASPSPKPARTSLALSESALSSGKKEGHLIGTAITHLAFVGRRHTAIVTGDESGRAFWWSLGKVIGVESNDVIRLWGPPIPASAAGSRSLASTENSSRQASRTKTAKEQELFAATPLPIGSVEHLADNFGIIALLTAGKMMIVGLKPSARTLYRRSRQADGGRSGRSIGCAAWLPARAVSISGKSMTDPVLAYSWGNQLRFLKVQVSPAAQAQGSEAQKGQDFNRVGFIEGRIWREEEPILRLDWFNSTHILLATSLHIGLLDIGSMRKVEQQSFSWLSDLSYISDERGKESLVSLTDRVCTYKGKVFALTKSDIRIGSVLSWADRILALCHAGDFIAAIDLTIQYYSDTAPGNTIGLPVSTKARRMLLRTRALSLMRASLQYAFSEDRLTDGTYNTPNGRGVDLTPLFEGLVECCLQACLVIGEQGFIFDDVFEAYAHVGIQGIYLGILAKHLLEDRVTDVPPHIVQALISHHAQRGEYQQAEQIIWHVDPIRLDVNQSIILCETHGLWDAYVYVHNQCLKDYTTPIATLIKSIDASGQKGLDQSMDDFDLISQQATRLYRYIEITLSGNIYPGGQPALLPEAEKGREAVYGCLFSLTAPRDSAFSHISGNEVYPILQKLLRLDTEALLHTLDVAFEDAYLNDNHGFLMSRQLIVNILLEIMEPQSYHASDITLLHIFVARNLPKYPQFILVSPSTLHQILKSLACDPDLSTRDDRELAAESLLSAYTPYDTDAIYQQFRSAGFWRILRSAYRNDGNWIEALKVDIADDSLHSSDYFEQINEVLAAGLKTSQASSLLDIVEASLPQLLDTNVAATAMTLEQHLPSLHAGALSLLDSQAHRQLGYLTVLIEPQHLTEALDKANTTLLAKSKHVTEDMYVTYLSLLCELDPDRLIPFIDCCRGVLDGSKIEEILERAHEYDTLVWHIYTSGQQQRAFEELGRIMESATTRLLQASVSRIEEASAMRDIERVARMGLKLVSQPVEQADLTQEDSWYYILSRTLTIIRRIHQTQTISVYSTNTVLPTLRILVQDELSALLSGSGASRVAFPQLFKRLMDQLDDATGFQSSETNAEMKLILTSMLRAYATDEEVLKITARIIGNDLHVLFAELVQAKSQGWKARDDICRDCGVSVLLKDEEVDIINRKLGSIEEQSRVIVTRGGENIHEMCISVA